MKDLEITESHGSASFENEEGKDKKSAGEGKLVDDEDVHTIASISTSKGGQYNKGDMATFYSHRKGVGTSVQRCILECLVVRSATHSAMRSFLPHTTTIVSRLLFYLTATTFLHATEQVWSCNISHMFCMWIVSV